MPEPERLAAVAVEAALASGAVQKEKFGGILAVDKKLADDIKLEADRLCERAMVSIIRKNFPNHAILAEESGDSAGSGYRWYIDPLDGTVNFYHGIPYYCTTLACYRTAGGEERRDLGEPLVGVTYAPPTDELFVGVMGKGTTLNGRPVRVREEENLAEAMILTTFGNNEKNIRFTREVTLDLCLRVRKTRNLGAAAYDLANVAAGRASGFLEHGLNPWDIAAGKVLVEAAGGIFVATCSPGNRWGVAASGRNINPALVEALARVPL